MPRHPDLRRAAAALLVLLGVCLGQAGPACAQEPGASRPAFANGFPTTSDFFPIGVWLQSPHNAEAYRAMGINTFVGLWQPPTEEVLAHLERNGMFAIVEPSPAVLALGNARVVRGWLQGDEPDNAQSNGSGGWGDCILPDEVVRRYRDMRALDTTRPVLLNFGQAVANPAWFGRGDRCSRIPPSTYYPAASAGADIVSFDIYPAAEERQRHVMGRLELVGRGVANLRRWARPGQPVWSAIETTHINNPQRRPLPGEVRSEVWMALIHGASGIFYFLHEWQPTFREDGIRRYPDTVAEVTRLNRQIGELAPVLNAPPQAGGVRVEAAVEIAAVAKVHAGHTYVFAVSMDPKPAKARLILRAREDARATLLGEDRSVAVRAGVIEDDFPGYGVRLYQIPQRD